MIATNKPHWLGSTRTLEQIALFKCRHRVTALSRGALVFAAIAALYASAPPEVQAQAQVRNFPTQPILVVNTGGHNAPVRSLVFSAADGSQLLSGGMDKIVNVWSLAGGRAELARTIRPPIWRGYRGVIYAMALSPAVEGRQQLLAIAGYGVENTRGTIVLFRYPGAPGASTGEVAAILPSGTVNQPEPAGHTNTVMALAFDPRGNGMLASCGLDGTVRLWDTNSKTSVGVLRGHVGPVNNLAYGPDGHTLATGGQDGVVRLWDVDRRVLLAQAAPNPADRLANDPAGDAILCLGYSSDGRWLVIGRENGLLLRYDAPALRTVARLNPTVRGPVEALAISHDSQRVATSIVARRNAPADRPRVDCEIELRGLVDGRFLGRVDTVSNLAYALAFSPDDHILACSGGDAQGVYLKDLTNATRPRAGLEGQGRSVWDVGFAPDSQAVAFARTRADIPGQTASYEGFDLNTRQYRALDRATLARAITSLQGWSIVPSGPYGLIVTNSQGARYPITLDPQQDRRWWSYSFIPSGPGHATNTVAIGCEGGVAIYVFDNAKLAYRRTRLLAGHSGAVYALAPARDGRWLATGSADQTVRLWRLAACDATAPLGATFGPAEGGGLAAKEVEPLGFAEAMGLKPGDVIEAFYQNGAPVDVALLPDRKDSEPPGTLFEFRVRRGAEHVNLGTTRRDTPALTLFSSIGREWVLWMPEGYYDTSIVGDRRFLGWQRNRAALNEPTDFFTADRFEQELRRPDVLGRLWSSADPASALALLANPKQDPAQLVDAERPPGVRVVEPARQPGAALVIPGGALGVRALAAAESGRPISSIRFLVDSQQGPRFDFNPPRADVDQQAQLNLTPGTHRVNVVATNDRGKERVESFDVAFGPVRDERPRLIVRTIGVNQVEGQDRLAIAYADRDARDVARFFNEQGGPRTSGVDQNEPLVAGKATAAHIKEVMNELLGKLEHDELAPGDVVIVMLEAHVLELEGNAGSQVVGSDAGTGMPPEPSVAAAALSDGLGRLADYGCRVMLLVDGVHASAPKEWNCRVNAWARDLWKRNVIAFVASNQGPSERLALPQRHGAFAQGILESLDVPSRSRLWVDPAGPLTLHDFQEAVVQRVQDLTSRRQVAACYVPETLPSKLPLLEARKAAAAGARPGSSSIAPASDR